MATLAQLREVHDAALELVACLHVAPELIEVYEPQDEQDWQDDVATSVREFFDAIRRLERALESTKSHLAERYDDVVVFDGVEGTSFHDAALKWGHAMLAFLVDWSEAYDEMDGLRIDDEVLAKFIRVAAKRDFEASGVVEITGFDEDAGYRRPLQRIDSGAIHVRLEKEYLEASRDVPEDADISIPPDYRVGGKADGQPLTAEVVKDLGISTSPGRDIEDRVSDPRKKNRDLFSWEACCKHCEKRGRPIPDV